MVQTVAAQHQLFQSGSGACRFRLPRCTGRLLDQRLLPSSKGYWLPGQWRVGHQALDDRHGQLLDALTCQSAGPDMWCIRGGMTVWQIALAVHHQRSLVACDQLLVLLGPWLTDVKNQYDEICGC